MKWEWRTFMFDEQKAKSMWESIGGTEPAGENQWVFRTDDYVPAGDALGVKFRDQGRAGLECKFRVARKKRGAELWIKQQFGFTSGEGGVSDKEEEAVPGGCTQQISPEVEKFMRNKLSDAVPDIKSWLEKITDEMKKDFPECKDACDDAVQVLSRFHVNNPQPVPIVSLRKRILKEKHKKKATVELDHLEVSATGVPSMSIWSIGLDAKDPKQMYSLLDDALGKDSDDRMGKMAAGYPAFVQRFAGSPDGEGQSRPVVEKQEELVTAV